MVFCNPLFCCAFLYCNCTWAYAMNTKFVYTMVYIDNNQELKTETFICNDENPWLYIWEVFSVDQYQGALVYNGMDISVVH